MTRKIYILIIIAAMLITLPNNGWARKKKVGQSGMTYLAISMGARESAMGDASTASVQGINGMWHNPAVTADIKGVSVIFNQVSWLVETKLYGTAMVYSSENWGAFGVDLTYMDFGEIMGTQIVPQSQNYRGFITTGDIGVEDYAIGFSYARRISDKFSFGIKLKHLHEDLGQARYVYKVENEGDENEIKYYTTADYAMNNWGIDFGTVYDVGWKGLIIAMTMQNLSRDMAYWYEEFSLPTYLRIGMAMDVAEIFQEGNKDLDINVAVDAIHPNDYTERVHIGTEILYLQRFAIRGGYKFNHDVESATFGVGVKFSYSNYNAIVDYAYTSAEYFSDINRISLQISF